MKSSKKNKNDIDDISRETQRIISDSHVRLPYHKSKQKSLKDFLNRHKMSTECQVSITGSKKLLQKAWDFIEIKEQNVEQFYNEDGCQSEHCEKTSSPNDNIESDQTFSLIDNYNKELITKGEDDEEENFKHKNIILENSDEEENFNYKNIISENSDEEENFNYKNIISENSDEEENFAGILSKNSDDEEDNCSQASSLCFENSLTKKVLRSENDEHSENDSNSSDFEMHTNHHNIKKNIVKDYIDDEAESSELEYSSDDSEDNLPTFIDESDDDVKEFSKKKRYKKLVLSESSDDESISNTEDKLTSDDLIRPLFNEPNTNISTQQLIGLCSGEFLTQHSELEEINEDSDDDFDSSVPQKDSEHKLDLNINNEDFEEIPKLTSAKDFFDEEAELSESDWSSDDEDHLVDNIDTLEEEIGDRDALDEDIVKDGLDKIYMRQLLDDDKEQVSALKEMLLEDGNLHSDSGRKRKFQWETDENDSAFKKPLFSDNEDNDEEENDDDTTEQWRTERFKREAYLTQKNKIEEEKSNNILQTSNSVVRKSTDISQSNNKLIKGSFMKHTNTKKMATTLLYINKKTIVTNNDETHTIKYEEKNQIKYNANSNSFAYLLKSDNKPEIKNDDLMSKKKENICLRNSHTSTQSTQIFHETNQKSANSILKQLE